MLIKNFKNKKVIVRSLSGHIARFGPREEREVPEVLVDECIKMGLIPSDEFKKAIEEASENEADELELEQQELGAQSEVADRLRSEAMANAQAEVMAEAEAAAELKAKRSAAAKKAAATKKANANK